MKDRKPDTGRHAREDEPDGVRAEIDERDAFSHTVSMGPINGRSMTPRAAVSHGDGCACRKPRPGMFVELARVFPIDLAASTHVGDSPKDREAALAAGVGRFAWAVEFFGW